jgi:hypothetical protein
MCTHASPDPASRSNPEKTRAIKPQVTSGRASLAKLLNEHLNRRAMQAREQFSETALADFVDLAQ